MATGSALPRVRLSVLLRDDLKSEGYDPYDFGHYFAEWKSLGPAGEYADPYFGKDSLYERPLRNNTRVLRHVHLRPEGFPDKIKEWDRLHDLGARKTSNAVLIYVYDPVHGYLLLHMVREPDGHVFSEMKTPDTDLFMNQLADVAEEFIYFGAVNL